jgi:signal transduction histidine kinase/ActR/RegA family two-component response regulator
VTGGRIEPPVRGRLTGLSLRLRLLAILLLIFAVGAALFALVVRTAIDNAREQQLQDAGVHYAARIAALQQGWRVEAYAAAQQLELWQGGDSAASPEARDARLHAVLVTLLDPSDFSHAVITDTEGRVLFRHGTRSQDTPELPAASDAAGLGWVFSASDRTVYRTLTGPFRYGKQVARLLLYLPLDNALLARMAYPGTRLELLQASLSTAVSDPAGGGASAASAGPSARLLLPWDGLAGAPVLQIDRSFPPPLSRLQLLAIMAVCAVLFAVSAWFVLGRWLRLRARRLAQLQGAAVTFAAEPVLSAELVRQLDSAAQVPDEIGVLASNLRAMMRRIEAGRHEQAQASEALSRLNATLEDRVADRTRELELARDAAWSATRAKEQFLSNMSHEIRTPMNGMLGALELMSRTPLDAVQLRYIEVASTSGQALLDVINDVLDFAKIGAGRLALASDPIAINELARSVVTLFSVAAQQKSLDLQLDADPTLGRWHLGDAMRLRQVLINLVSNAIKFTSQGGVVVQTRSLGGGDADAERIAFEVRDSGIGIDDADQQRIFDAFVQADPSAHRRQGGTGLGLTISRELVRAMGGEITVSSSPGQGTAFRFELPLRRVAAAAAPSLAAPDPAHAPLDGLVLLVEDNAVNRLVGAAMLESLGLTVLLAEDGEQALARLQSQPVALVLMDCQMPVLDGFDTTRRLRELEKARGLPATPVVALSASAMAADVELCLAAGMNAHLAKPYTLAQLHAAVVTWAPKVRAGARANWVAGL